MKTMENILQDTELSDNEIVHLTLSIWDLTDSYNRHAAVTLYSFLEHTNKQVHVHFLYDESLSQKNITEAKKNRLFYQIIANKFDAIISYHHIVLPDWVSTLSALKKWSVATLLRLYIPDILKDISKVIYLDCDIVVNTDVLVLWYLDLHGAPIAACPDSSRKHFSPTRKSIYKKVGIDSSDYFCAGVMVMNLNKLREMPSLSDETLSYLKDNPNTPYLDQDALNWYFKSNYYQIDEKYNIYSLNCDDVINTHLSDCIIHYSSIAKPWKVYSGTKDDLYWKYLLQTPWADNKYELLQYVRSAPDLALCCEFLPKMVMVYPHPKKLIESYKLLIKIIQSVMSYYWTVRRN